MVEKAGNDRGCIFGCGVLATEWRSRALRENEGAPIALNEGSFKLLSCHATL